MAITYDNFRTHRQMLSLMITPMITGSISFVASATLITMILRSNLKLSTVYRRLIFGISVCDLFQSLGSALSSVPMPVGSWVGAVGNNISCDAQGALIIAGTTGSILYSISLSIYFLTMIRHQASERVIKNKFERYLHAVPIVFTVVATTLGLWLDEFNPHSSSCTAAISPMFCTIDPEVECLHYRRHMIMAYIFIALPLIIALIWNVVTMVMIWRTEYLLAKKNQTYRSGWLTTGAAAQRSPRSRSTNDNNTVPTESVSTGTPQRNRNHRQQPLGALAARLSRPSLASIRRRKEIANRGIAYIICFLLTYIFPFLFRIWGHTNTYPPYVLELLKSIFLPLQGLFNIIIYTYPHVVSCRRTHPEYSWLRTFFEVVRSGGDSDQMMASQLNRSIFSGRAKKRKSIRNEPVVLDYDERNKTPIERKKKNEERPC